eukprot:CAMPEP_0185200054 /NCGR_PEP_ID=MMETSP1140-20130426/46436_1 /TAXON_ID=298111 /ORGANISM="Pavlova sp., Strain CCMP459" /LENGTH=135 /DNA_ID=CAMNT_0027767361 /DNA_START=67 /DNA_END=470 /DNA_ORIENTATION=+
MTIGRRLLDVCDNIGEIAMLFKPGHIPIDLVVLGLAERPCGRVYGALDTPRKPAMEHPFLLLDGLKLLAHRLLDGRDHIVSVHLVLAQEELLLPVIPIAAQLQRVPLELARAEHLEQGQELGQGHRLRAVHVDGP